MKFALVNNEKCEAIQGTKGICPVCFASVIAKCGDIKIHHWAHKSIKTCDTWWEQETEWHRQWKDRFPKEYQEVVLFDEQTREKHIADIKTHDGVVFEFQHSHITSQERESREFFYKNMVWVVDGTRLKRDYQRFQKAFTDGNITQTQLEDCFFVQYPTDCFPQDWISSAVPVFFDFKGLLTIEQQDPFREPLWCFLPRIKGKNTYYSNGYKVTNWKRDMLISVQRELLVTSYQQLLKKINE